MKTIPVSVYRSDRIGDCTNGGVSSIYNTLYVVCEDGFKEVDDRDTPENVMKLVVLSRRGQMLYHLEPVAKPEGAGWMFGGNYAASSDARFCRMIDSAYCAIPIHDRQESWELYESNFR